jgi:hypothetical protein
MKTVRVTFKNGDTITTPINGTLESIAAYYRIGRYFNLGEEGDNMQPVTKLEFLIAEVTV